MGQFLKNFSSSNLSKVILCFSKVLLKRVKMYLQLLKSREKPLNEIILKKLIIILDFFSAFGVKSFVVLVCRNQN